MMWEERKPEPGETVKIEFSKWTGMGIQIGIYLSSLFRAWPNLCMEF